VTESEHTNADRRESNPATRAGVAVVTGGGDGIGGRVSGRLSAAGYHVVMIGRREEPLRAACDAISDEGGVAEYVVGSVSDRGDVDTLFDRVSALGRGLKVLVNNAGGTGPTKPLVEIDEAEWDDVFAVNVKGVFLCCQRAIPLMEAAGEGRIVNVGSVAGKRPLVNRTPYVTSKTALIGLTRTLAHEVGPLEITVNTVCPFLVEGDRLTRVLATMAPMRGMTEDELYSDLSRDSALGRGVSEDEVAGLILFLCSPDARNMTGQDINISAGTVMY
jgi:NAD(P)-dependent dehydrogenase (short-subunit alcohol dehydrogenase family)